MAEPITNLTMLWVDEVGITFSWTAAEDVSNLSEYKIYYLNDSGTYPVWTLLKTLLPIAVKSPLQTSHVLTVPATSYLVEWSQLMAWAAESVIPFYLTTSSPNKMPACMAVQITHVDSTGTESEPLAYFAFPNSYQNNILPIHFQNNFGFDNNGQVKVYIQDTIEELTDSVSMLLGTELGQRTVVPRYGIEDLPFQKIDVNLIGASLANWEPRAKVDLSVNVNDDGTEYVNVQLLNN